EVRGTAVASCAFDAGEVCVESCADDRVCERQRPTPLEDPRDRQQLCRLAGLGLVQACELRRLEQVALLENCERPGEPSRVFGQPTEPKANRATHASGTDSLDLARALRRRTNPFFAYRLQERAQQKRRAACR